MSEGANIYKTLSAWHIISKCHRLHLAQFIKMPIRPSYAFAFVTLAISHAKIVGTTKISGKQRKSKRPSIFLPETAAPHPTPPRGI